MTSVDYAPFNSEDNTYYLNSDEQSGYDAMNSDIKKMNEVAGIVKFECPTTLEQLWKEIENGAWDNTADVTFAEQNALRHTIPVRYKSLLHVFYREHSPTSFGKPVNVQRSGDLILGVKCRKPGPVEIEVGGVHKFTKQCEIGFNLFTKEEIVPMGVLVYHVIYISGDVCELVVGSILDKGVRKELGEYYSNPENPTLYCVQSGLDTKATESKKAEVKFPVIDIEKTDWMASSLKVVYKDEE